MAFQEDIDQFFNADEFADEATFTGLPSVVGILEKNYVRSVGGIGMENSEIALLLPNKAVPANVISREVTINSVTYVVADKAKDNDMPDVTALFLEVK